MVGVGRALVSSSTRILLLDEPAAGLDKSETAWFGQQLRRLVDRGYTMLLIDHDMGLVLNVCDHIHMLVFGELVTSGSPDELRHDPEVIAAYLGPGARGPGAGHPGRGGGRVVSGTDGPVLDDRRAVDTGYDGVAVVRDLSLTVDGGRGGGPARPERGGQDHDPDGGVGHGGRSWVGSVTVMGRPGAQACATPTGWPAGA